MSLRMDRECCHPASLFLFFEQLLLDIRLLGSCWKGTKMLYSYLVYLLGRWDESYHCHSIMAQMILILNTAVLCIVLPLTRKGQCILNAFDPSISTNFGFSHPRGSACIFCVVSAQLSALEAARYLALIHKGVALGLLRRASPCLYGQIGLV